MVQRFSIQVGYEGVIIAHTLFHKHEGAQELLIILENILTI